VTWGVGNETCSPKCSCLYCSAPLLWHMSLITCWILKRIKIFVQCLSITN
jgi:hypothetical protein